MIVTLGHTKGGVGKSTLALNVAIERQRRGVDTLLIDGDPRQTSVSKAIAIRGDSGIKPELSCIFWRIHVLCETNSNYSKNVIKTSSLM